MAESSTQDDPRFERAIAEARERQSCGLRGREALARAAMAVAFLATAAGVAKNRAEALLMDGVRDEWLIVTPGAHNAKLYRVRRAED